MKPNFFKLLLGAALIAGLFSCSDDDKKVSSSVTVAGKKYAFEDGYYYAFKADEASYYDVYVFGTSSDGQFAQVEFDLISQTAGELPVGNYTFSESSETLDRFSITLRNANEEVINEFYEMKNGNLEVKKSGDTYTITFSLTFYDGQGEVKIKGTYKGALGIHQ